VDRVRLTFDVQGETAQQIRERAENVVREFIGAEPGTPLSQVTEMEINVEGTSVEGQPAPPLPSYNFIGHVHVRIKS
jgi:hypothetical protein